MIDSWLGGLWNPLPHVLIISNATCAIYLQCQCIAPKYIVQKPFSSMLTMLNSTCAYLILHWKNSFIVQEFRVIYFHSWGHLRKFLHTEISWTTVVLCYFSLSADIHWPSVLCFSLAHSHCICYTYPPISHVTHPPTHPFLMSLMAKGEFSSFSSVHELSNFLGCHIQIHPSLHLKSTNNLCTSVFNEEQMKHCGRIWF